MTVIIVYRTNYDSNPARPRKSAVNLRSNKSGRFLISPRNRETYASFSQAIWLARSVRCFHLGSACHAVLHFIGANRIQKLMWTILNLTAPHLAIVFLKQATFRSTKCFEADVKWKVLGLIFGSGLVWKIWADAAWLLPFWVRCTLINDLTLQLYINIPPFVHSSNVLQCLNITYCQWWHADPRGGNLLWAS